MSDTAQRDVEALVGKNDSWVHTWTDSSDWFEYPLMIDNQFIVQRNTTQFCPETCNALRNLISSGVFVKIAGFS